MDFKNASFKATVIIIIKSTIMVLDAIITTTTKRDFN
jgi:hypothetical protein